ncbi:MAG: AMP-binding protein [Gammaproteobacteria bacterium]
MPADTFFNLLSDRSQQNPQGIAIQALDRKALTYSELINHIRAVTSHLNDCGIGRNDRVAVVLPNGPEMATACLGVAAGAACIPLNPEYKIGEFEYFLSHLNARLLLILAGMKSPARTVAESLNIPILEIHNEEQDPAGLFRMAEMTPCASASETGLAQADDTALILNTSGTTSQPKIVPLTHRNISASALNLIDSLKLTAGDCVLNMMPMFHIGGLLDLLIAPLAAGGKTVCEPNFSIDRFVECLENFHPTWHQGVPAMLQEILNHSGEVEEAFERGALRFIRSVSSPLPEKLAGELETLFDSPVIEIYGMTETSGLIAGNPLPPGQRKKGSVGISAGPEIAVFDESCRPLAANQKGEVVVKGETVMPGYEGHPGINEETFSGSWFRTGDQGYLDEDGYLFLTGRIKEIINRGGEKVSPREVDDVILTHPAIAEAATFALPHASLGEDVAIGVVPKQGAVLRKEDLIGFLSERLAYFKVPRTVFFLDAIPKGPGGKILRSELSKNLRKDDAGPAPARPKLVLPETPVANILAGLWSDALGIDPVGIYDNFFDLGGDSLKAAVFINKLQEDWGETIYVSAIFDAPSIAEFEAYLNRNYPEMVAKMLGRQFAPSRSGRSHKIGEEQIAQFRKSIRNPLTPSGPLGKKNPTAIFVLSAPRSGSTLLRVMLGGNPHLFSPPELYLLSFSNLAERKIWLTGTQKYRLEGNIRCLMQIKNQSADEALSLMEHLEKNKTPTQEYYRMLQDWIGNRLLVDKTPTYNLHMETLERAEMYFENPIYIHLQRHPYGMIRSFEEAKLDQLWYPYMVGEDYAHRFPCPYQSSELAEMTWLVINRNIVDFLQRIPDHRRYDIKFEDIVNQPEPAMKDLCNFLDLQFDQQMLQPQQDKANRMTDGVHSVSRMVGDMKFHQHKGISSNSADLWKTAYDVDFLCDETWKLASSLGYDETIASANDRQDFEI